MCVAVAAPIHANEGLASFIWLCLRLAAAHARIEQRIVCLEEQTWRSKRRAQNMKCTRFSQCYGYGDCCALETCLAVLSTTQIIAISRLRLVPAPGPNVLCFSTPVGRFYFSTDGLQVMTSPANALRFTVKTPPA